MKRHLKDPEQMTDDELIATAFNLDEHFLPFKTPELLELAHLIIDRGSELGLEDLTEEQQDLLNDTSPDLYSKLYEAWSAAEMQAMFPDLDQDEIDDTMEDIMSDL